MDFGEDASALLWKYGGMTSAAIGAITTLTLVVLNALSDSESRRRYKHRNDDEDSKNHHGSVGNDYPPTNHTSNHSNGISADKNDDVDNDVDDDVGDDVDNDVDDEKDRIDEHQHLPVNDSSDATSNQQNKRSSKKRYYTK